MNLQVANFQRCEHAFHQHQAWVKLQIALHLLLLMILQLYHLPPPVPPPFSNSSCLFTWCQPPYASCCTVLLYLLRYCTVLKMFSLLCLLVFYVLFVWKVLQTYYNTVLYSRLCFWMPRLTLLGLRNKWDLRTHSRSRTRLCVGNLLYLYICMSKCMHKKVYKDKFKKFI